MQEASNSLSTGQAVEKAIKLAQDAVREDEAGNIEEAITLYQTSVDLIKLGLQVQRETEVVDISVLHKYMQLYNDRIAELSRSLIEDEPLPMDFGEVPAASPLPLNAGASGPAGGSSSAAEKGVFSYEDADLNAAKPPLPPPAGKDEWRRPFWFMRILRNSMEHGGFLTPDGRVFVPRRLWVQKGARFTAMAAKLECAQCLLAELRRVSAVDYKQPAVLSKELAEPFEAAPLRPDVVGGACRTHLRRHGAAASGKSKFQTALATCCG